MGPALLALPSAALMILFFAVPVALILRQSFLAPGLSLEFYRRIVTVPVYGLVFWISFKIALLSAFASMMASYPVAYTLLVVRPLARSVMLAVILVPFWTNVLIRCYAWILILQKNGAANTVLVDWLHLVSAPLPLLFNLGSVLIGLVHYLVPVNILVLYTAMQRIDLRLLKAAQGLGADPLKAFAAVFLPLSMPGVWAAATLIFVVALGFFVTPALLGGSHEITIAMQVDTYFTETVDWGLGSALAATLLALALAGIGLSRLFQSRAAVR